MKVIVAKTAGFCWGVRRAMDAVLEASSRRQDAIQTLGPLIHNPQALELLARRGVGVADSPEAVRSGTVVIRAHGIPIQQLRGLKERQKQDELDIVNATCPEVAKVHSKIKKWSAKNYFTVILGTHGHAESTAHQSFAEHGATIVSNLEEAKALSDDQLKKVLVVAQTTFTAKDFDEISAYIRSRAGEGIFENTICQDTWRRQEEAAELAQTVDYVIVVGGKSSSNTKHLAELARHYGKPVQYVETAEELDLAVLPKDGSIGVLAGASTPTWLVEEVVEVLEECGNGARRFARFMDAAFGTPTLTALGAGLMTMGVHRWMGLPAIWQYPAITAAYTAAMYLLAPYLDPLGVGTKGPARARFLERNRKIMLGTGVTALLLALFLATWMGLGSLLVVAMASACGLTYKRGIRIGNRYLSLQSIPASKDLLVALALAVVAVALPLWHHGWTWNRTAWAGVLLVAAQAFARTTIHYIRDMQNDQILGKDTLPILLGRGPAKAVIGSTLALALIAALWLNPVKAFAHPFLVAAVLVAASVYPLMHLWFFHERFTTGKNTFEPSVELSFYILGLLALI